ncbi:hypothetical protein K461DRAFT_282588 [Myriangium duriaei CBS 260.36]|uniref:2EXR domain-containing protein n=1 Tax=Myriangium duriaei CBS 260.36 TaxID=1168546 RepID=A0A9P4ISD5_9PEZI|nr:hypothetical protein K461DRAFT_282588 [Myriangium duriaei CBS 260.36]
MPPKNCLGTTEDNTKFALFPKLPFELRALVWHHALPNIATSYLFRWRQGGWSVRPVSRPDAECLIDFNYEVLGRLTISSPPAFVNHEAQDIVHKWMHDHSIKYNQIGPHTSAFSRYLHPELDAMYVPPVEFDAFGNEWEMRQRKPDIWSRYHFFDSGRCISYIAISEACLSRERAYFPTCTVRCHSRIQALLVVLDAPASLDNAEGIADWWKFEYLPEGGVFVWNEDLKVFELDGKMPLGYEDHYRRIKEAIATFHPDSVWWQVLPNKYEVRPVLATRP